MTLQPGCRFAAAPRFHLPRDWSGRFLVGAGVGEADGRFSPLGPWRPPTPAELALLREPAAEPSSEGLEERVSLFQLPRHLHSEWWEVLDRAVGWGDRRLPGLDGFVGRVGAFLAFKGLPLPERARCDVVVSRPGQRSVLWDAPADRPAGEACPPRRWGAINLGDEDTSLALINLPPRQQEAELRRRFPDPPAGATVGELAGRFLRCCADYPPLRLILGPGEGCRLPEAGLILDGCPEDKQEPDVLLWVSLPAHPAT